MAAPRPLSVLKALSEALSALHFAPPVTHVYNPLEYAWAPFSDYVERYGTGRKEVLFLGMNPGPYGMAQTGVPFGDVAKVRDWLGITGTVGAPSNPHPKRPVQGWACPRSEVSGTRLWGWAADTWSTPEAFFARHFVYNYCPLCFMEAGGRNLTPDKLPKAERAPLEARCDEALARLVDYWKPAYCIGVGQFAEKRLRTALPAYTGVIGRIPHPSPASPAANRGWAPAASAALADLGLPTA